MKKTTKISKTAEVTTTSPKKEKIAPKFTAMDVRLYLLAQDDLKGAIENCTANNITEAVNENLPENLSYDEQLILKDEEIQSENRKFMNKINYLD